MASRQKWARSRDEGYRHRYDQVTRNRSEAKTEQYKFYKSKAWAGLRAQVLARDDHIDQYLKLLGIYEVADTVDHIVPIEFEPDQMQNPDNLISCGRHTHLIKTRWEKKYYFDRGGQPKSVEPIREIGKILPILAP
ncbi:hypothetical protein KIMC2_14500 [Xylocopilactobacillus apis]|uniref:HNH endonuclease n=1 Tax=Xylocopilactobacillus apis TaxID=2932183 RepID=A0AAU9DPD9_9LACO|nr:hypothetical protein KIMC2_14500 [Xylocopilactobacillus apis]